MTANHRGTGVPPVNHGPANHRGTGVPPVNHGPANHRGTGVPPVNHGPANHRGTGVPPVNHGPANHRGTGVPPVNHGPANHPSQEIPSVTLAKAVLILGGGLAGATIATALAELGIGVTLVEQASRSGGDQLLPELLIKRPTLSVLTESAMRRLEGSLGSFRAHVRSRGGEESVIDISCVAVATGSPIRQESPAVENRERVVFIPDLARELAGGAGLVRQGRPVERVTYLLDGREGGIKIAGLEAIKQALLLQEQFSCQVSILCRDVMVSADNMEHHYRQAREKGVLFVKYDEPPRVSDRGDCLEVQVRDAAALGGEEGLSLTIPTDLLALAETYDPRAATEGLVKLLRLRPGPEGFLMDDNPQLGRVGTNRRGIFIAGACRFPQDREESRQEALAVVEKILALLTPGSYRCDHPYAEVEPEKCALCYTCPRLCPHAAISVDSYASANIYSSPGGRAEQQVWTAARVAPAACFGCGICVAECPARAIRLNQEGALPGVAS